MGAPRVEGMNWADFREFFRGRWKKGEHVALVGPTGRGKTTALVQVTDHRDKVVLLDPKGGDRTLRRSGFDVITRWPPPQRRQRKTADWWHGRDGEAPRPIRVIYSPKVRTMADYQMLPEAYSRALQDIFTQRGWTVGIDEGRLAADYFNLKDEITMMYIAARDKEISVLTAIQAPRWVPREIMDQSSWLIVWPVRDRDTQGRVAEVLGEERAVIREVLETISFHDCLVLDVPQDRLIITRPTKV